MSRRVRRHANPFNCVSELGAIDRRALFGREGSVELELGSATGGVLFARARNHPELDFVGIEVRKPVVDQAMAAREAAGGPLNAVVLYGNGTAALTGLLPAGVVQCFHVHFPDPWPKKRHWKRRILNPGVVRDMAAMLPIGGRVYAQSDVEPLAAEMYEFLAADGALESRLDPSMRVERPFPEATEWELHHERHGAPVFRMLFEKVREPSGEVPALEHRATGPLPPDAVGAADSEVEG
jgi:tRNA (guanine-N7-)-methyltransferase